MNRLVVPGTEEKINRFIAELAGDIDGESYDCSTESSRAYVELLSEGEYCK